VIRTKKTACFSCIVIAGTVFQRLYW